MPALENESRTDIFLLNLQRLATSLDPQLNGALFINLPIVSRQERSES